MNGLLEKFSSPAGLVLLMVTVSVVVLLGAYGFEIIGGLAPCRLCYYQRAPYALAIGIGVMMMMAPKISRPGYILLLLCYLAGTALALYHSGVEWRWWAGPASCSASGASAPSVEALMAEILATPVIRCDEVPWSLFGISLAGYNFLISFGLMVLSFYTLRKERGHDNFQK